MSPFRLLAVLLATLLTVASVSAATFGVSVTQVEIAVPQGINHLPVRLPITHSGSLSGVSASSNSGGWVTAAIDRSTDELVLTFTTAGQTGPNFPATVSLTDGSATVQLTVKVYFSPLNIVRLIDDPVRSRMYGLHQYGTGLGTLVIYDPIRETYLGCITVGMKSTDFVLNSDGTEALVISAGSQALYPVDLARLQSGPAIPLPAFSHGSGPVDTTAHIAYGPGSVVYYTDSYWAPTLRALDRSTGNVIQTVQNTAGPNDSGGNASYGFGAIAYVPGLSALFTWAQVGASAGINNSCVNRFSAKPDGTLAFATQVSTKFPRDPLTSPVLVSTDNTFLAVKTLMMAGSDTTVVHSFPDDIVVMSPGGEIVGTSAGLYETASGNKLYALPSVTSVQAITSDYARLVYFDSTYRVLHSVNLSNLVGSAVLHRELSPQAGAIVLAPAQLSWSPVSGADSYRVYLGAQSAAVTAATPASSSEYLGTVGSPSFTLPNTLPAGTYYWRIDGVSGTDIATGDVHTFTVASVAVSLPEIKASTVQGDSSRTVTVSLTNPNSPQAWTATASAPWIILQPSGNSTPATLKVRLDASLLPLGQNTGSITLATAGGSVDLPVKLQVDALKLTLLRSDPHSSRIYAISEPALATSAYLLEIDSATETITRTVPVGKSVTDFTIHEGDNRIYVTNWSDGGLLAVDRTSFQVVRTYPFLPYPGATSEGDVYHVSAGGPGRLVIEAFDQWIDLSLFDTASGAILDTEQTYQGGGVYGPDKRYYYHGQSGGTGASLSKFDAAADKLLYLASITVVTSNSGLVVISDDGTRIFWNRGMYGEDLVQQWDIAAIIYATSADGRYAFSETSIYDTVQRKVLFSMPVKTQVSAFNTTSGKLLVQQGAGLAFYPISSTLLPATPALTAASVTTSSVVLSWNDVAFATDYALQWRQAGTSNWSSFSPPLAAGSTTYTVGGLDSGLTYEFRLKANGGQSGSDWSAVLTATTAITAPSAPVAHAIQAVTPGVLTLTWSISSAYDAVVIQRQSSPNGTWSTIATLGAGATTYTDVGLATGVTYSYRIWSQYKSVNSGSFATVSAYAPAASAPSITTQPGNRFVGVGDSAYFNVTSSGFPVPTYQWRKDGVAIPGATDPTLGISSVSTSHTGTYDVVITNSYGSVISSGVTLSILSPHSTYLGTFPGNNGYWALIVEPNGSGTFLGYLVYPNRAFVTGISLNADGTFASLPAGNGSGGGGVVVIPPDTPVITPPDVTTISNGSGNAEIAYHPTSEAKLSTITVLGVLGQGTIRGGIAEFSQSFDGFADSPTGPTSAYAGYLKVNQIAGQDDSLYAIVGHDGQALVLAATAGFVDAGLVNVSATGGLSGATLSGAPLTGNLLTGQAGLKATVTPDSGPALTFQNPLSQNERTDRLVNLASRGTSDTGNRVMILGFVIGGSAPRNVLVRGVGPTLASQGVTRPMANPMIELFNSTSDSIAKNEDWSAATNATAMADAATHTGAFALPPGSRDASLLVQLNPGAYSAITHDDHDTTGVALTEIYDVDGTDSTTPAIVNLSIRGNVNAGDGVLIAGFVITGNSPKRVLIRAVGPTLSTMDLQSGEILADPFLRIVQNGNTLLTNDNWGASANASDIVASSSSVGAFDLPTASKDAVILTTLAPGVYSAIASGVSGGTGIALVEVYQVP